jgi:hypothetical protein
MTSPPDSLRVKSFPRWSPCTDNLCVVCFFFAVRSRQPIFLRLLGSRRSVRSQCHPSCARLVAAEVRLAFVLWLSSINPSLPIWFFPAVEGDSCFCFCALELRGRFRESFFSLQSSLQPVIQFGCRLSFSIVCGSLQGEAGIALKSPDKKTRGLNWFSAMIFRTRPSGVR